MAAFGTAVTWASVGTNFTNDTVPYMSKTDNGFYIVRFTYNSDVKTIAVRSPLEILSEAMKVVVGTTASADINLLYTHANAFVTNAPGSIPLENTIGA